MVHAPRRRRDAAGRTRDLGEGRGRGGSGREEEGGDQEGPPRTIHAHLTLTLKHLSIFLSLSPVPHLLSVIEPVASLLVQEQVHSRGEAGLNGDQSGRLQDAPPSCASSRTSKKRKSACADQEGTRMRPRETKKERGDRRGRYSDRATSRRRLAEIEVANVCRRAGRTGYYSAVQPRLDVPVGREGGTRARVGEEAGARGGVRDCVCARAEGGVSVVRGEWRGRGWGVSHRRGGHAGREAFGRREVGRLTGERPSLAPLDPELMPRRPAGEPAQRQARASTARAASRVAVDDADERAPLVIEGEDVQRKEVPACDAAEELHDVEKVVLRGPGRGPPGEQEGDLGRSGWAKRRTRTRRRTLELTPALRRYDHA